MLIFRDAEVLELCITFFIPDRLPGTKVSKQVEHVFLFLISKGR